MPLLATYLQNLWDIRSPGAILAPLAVTYYVTQQCNLNCVYCEDFGVSRNVGNLAHTNLETVQRILTIIRQAADRLILTGGEPLLHPQLQDILSYARGDLKFREITLLSNGLALRNKPGILEHIDRLLISLDSTDPATWHTLVGAAREQAERIMDNIAWAASQQRARRFQMVVNCVLTRETLGDVDTLLKFCREHAILISFSPQSVQNWPDYGLIMSPEYQSVIRRIIALKQQGSPILASHTYLKTLESITPYTCHPTLIPRVLPDGGLIYPCRPIQRDGNSRGGSAVNLLTSGSLKDALRLAAQMYGSPPETCSSCFQQCYAEASLMQERPFDYLLELLRYAPVRRGGLVTFAPG